MRNAASGCGKGQVTQRLNLVVMNVQAGYQGRRKKWAQLDI
jgi:hypothetical protein